MGVDTAGLDQFESENGGVSQGTNPAAPAGAQQVGASGVAGEVLNQWMKDNGVTSPYAQQAQQWYTGANQEGTNNGWTSSFADAFVSGWQRSLEDGTAKTYFDRDNATGVVTWDHDSEDGSKSYQFGDIYEDGEFKGNVYDLYGRKDGNLMMAPWILDAKTQAETFGASDREDRLDREINAQREDRNANFEQSLDAMKFQEQVDARQEDIQSGWGDELLALGGAIGGGALTGGAAGAAGLNPLTVAAGAAGGALFGGTAAWLNRDSLSEQAARAIEITNMSYEEFGFGAGTATAVSQWSGVASRFITPLSNMTQGLYDASEGRGGDGESEFYRVDELGKSTTPMWVKAVDVGATVGDSLLQFASPMGLSMYSAQMTGMISGEVAELGFTGGSTFDYRRGGFDNIFTDEDGNFDASAGAAGIAKIGIDAVQLGMARGLAGKANALRAQVGDDAAYRTATLPTWLGGRTLAEGQDEVRAAGFSFIRNADGTIVEGSRRATLSLLAPSEQLTALSARVAAMRATGKAGGAVSADDFYRAAQSFSVGERKITGALVNAFGEGYEEVAQAILEPHSHGGTVTAGEIVNGFVYGAAAGAGMSLGTAARTPTADAQMYAMADAAYQLRNGGASLDRSEWDGYDDLQKRSMAAMAGFERETLETAYRKIAEDQAIETSAGVAGRAKLEDAIQMVTRQALSQATDRTDAAFVISQLEEVSQVDQNGNLVPGALPANGVGASALQTARNLNNHRRGMDIQGQSLERDIARLSNATPDEDTTRALNEARTTLARVQLAQAWGERFDEVFDRYLVRIMDTATPRDAMVADIEQLNSTLRDAFDMRIDSWEGYGELTREDKLALARATSIVYSRYPQDQAGSYQVLVPQVSAMLSVSQTDNFLEVSHAILTPISGDYDGDKIVEMAQLIFDDTEFTNARSGSYFLGAGESVNIGSPKFEKYNVAQMSEALASTNATLQSYASGTLVDLGRAITQRYRRFSGQAAIQGVLERFNEAIRANDKDARAVLLDGLAKDVGGEITAFARENLSNEWLWLDQLIVSRLQQFQEVYASHRPDVADVNTTQVSPNRQESSVRQRSTDRSATLGQTLANVLPGDSLFRKFQKLHYTTLDSPVLSAEGLAKTTVTEMAQLYRELGRQVTRSELDTIRSKDDITGRVYARLMDLAADAQRVDPRLNRFEAITLMANMAVADVTFDRDGTPQWNGTTRISLAQMLLRQSINEDRREKSRVLEASPELQAKHARLERMTRPGSTRGNANGAEEAFVEVFGSQQLFSLLGDEAQVFGPHLTVEQFVRKYQSLDEDSRRDVTRTLQNEAPYLGRARTRDMPYDLDEVTGDGDSVISAYRSVVDAILAVGNGRLSIDAQGNLSGDMAARSDRVSSTFRETHALARRALQEFAGLNPRRDGELNADLVRRMLEGNPDYARSVMNLIPNAAAAASFQVRDGEVFVANWLYEMFAISDPAAAEMHFLRNHIISTWNALGVSDRVNEEGELQDEKVREFGRLKSRFHRVMYALAAKSDGGLLLSKFIQQLETSNDPVEFMRWVNITPGVRGLQAPLTAWVDDTAEFDMDKAQGGWTTALEGAPLREAITMLQTSTEKLVGSLVAERQAMEADVRTMARIRRVVRAERGDDVRLEANDRATYEKFARMIDLAGDRLVSLGPQAMMYQTVGAVQGFYSSAHTKGQNPPNVEAMGSLDAMRDAFDYVTNYERLMASLTSVNLDAVGNNLGQVAKDGGRSMDDQGRQVEWSKPTPAEMLEMLENPDTRAYARAVLFPSVMERQYDGVARPMMLTGKSLDQLLSGASFNEMFPRNGKLAQEAAFRYVSFAEGVARKHGGHAAVQRAVNDLVIARTSAADHTLTEREIENMASLAYYEVAQVMQAVGSIYSAGTTDRMDAVFETVRSTQRSLRVARVLGIEVADLDTIDAVITDFTAQLESEMMDKVVALEDRLARDPSSAAAVEAEVDMIQAQHQRVLNQIELIRADDVAGQVVEMFSVPDSFSAADQQVLVAKLEKIAEYLQSHMQVIGDVPGAMVTLNKFTQQTLTLSRGGQYQLTEKEWGELSRVAIGHYLDDAMHTVIGTSVSVTPWPDADHVADQRYFDSSYAYLVESLLDPNSPLALAAREVHRVSGRQNDQVLTEDELFNLLGRTVLDGDRLGPWTSDIPRASMEANSRLDSSAAAPAIAMAGNSPKRQAAIIAGTRRTFTVPPETLLSRVTLGAQMIDGLDFDTVTATLPTGDVAMPLAQLDNRFARSVVIRGTTAAGEARELDLLQWDSNLGRPWMGNDSVATSGYLEINRSRLVAAAQRAAVEGLVPSTATVEVEFFHPDSQPSDPGFSNNVFFEGTSFALDADVHSSLIGTLWFTANGINQSSQRAALDASKLGKPALQVIDTVSSADRAAMETMWVDDMAAMLQAKARILVTTDMGYGEIGVEMFNAVYKDMKIRHYVIGRNEAGEQQVLSAEQVIEHQRANPGAPLPLEDARLWVPTDDVLRSMMGEQGTQGELYVDQIEVDPAMVPTFRGITETIRTKLELGLNGDTVALGDTRVQNRAHQGQLTVRTQLSQAERSAFDDKMAFFAEQRTEIWQDRGTERIASGFSASTNLQRAVNAGSNLLRAENLEFHWESLGIPFGPRDPANATLSAMLLRDLNNATEDNGYRTGWIYREGSAANPVEGTLSEVELRGQKKQAYRVAPGDLVVVELDGFAGNADLMRKRLDYFVDRGATVLLGATDGQTDMRAEASEYLVSDRNYAHVAGSQHAYQPAEMGSRYQNPRARVSNLLAVESVSRKNRVAVFNVQGLGIQEGAGWVSADNERLGAIGVSVNLVPTGSLGTAGVPVESFDGRTPQIDAVRQHLRGMDTAEGRALLKQLAHGKLQGDERDEADAELDASLDKMFRRFDDHPGTVLPQAGDKFGLGDIIPLIDSANRVVLYRHGFKAPSRRQIEEMAAQTYGDSLDAMNVAVFPSKRESAATVHTGDVVEFRPRAGYGLEVEINYPLSVFGDKKQLEWNGMKYVLVPKPDAIQLPEHGFFDGWGPDIVSDLDTLISKEATGDMVDNHRNAFAFFGVDFTSDMAEFFFPGQRGKEAETREILHKIATRSSRISYRAANEMINADRLAALATELLPPEVLGVWTQRLQNMSDPTTKIAAAMITYLLTPGARVEHVLRSGGFNDDSASPDAQSRKMPRLFTQIFDNAPLGSPLRTEINRRLNDQLFNPNGDGTGYQLLEDFTFVSKPADTGKRLFGKLQFAEAHSAGDNPVRNGMSFDEGGTGTISAHSAATVYGAIGAQTAMSRDITQARLFQEGTGIERFERDTLDGGAWRMFNAIPKKDVSFFDWIGLTPAESVYRDYAREAKVQFRQSIPKEEQYGWDTEHTNEYRQLSNDIMRQLGLLEKQAGIVDFWVRQILGMPAGVNEEGREHHVSGRGAVEAAKDILWNVENRYFPVVGAEQPQLHLHDLQAIYRANETRSTPWRPRTEMGRDATPASSWDDWVRVSLGTAVVTDSLFDPMYRLALDGFMHDYQSAMSSSMNLPISVDTAVDMQLLDPNVSKLVSSVDPYMNTAVSETMVLDADRASLDDVLGGRRIAGILKTRSAPASEVQKRRERRRQWRKENGVPIPVDVSMRSFRKNGTDLIDYGTTTNSLTRALINIRVGTALINPALWFSMPFELAARGSLDRLANIITGQQTTGATGAMQARITEWSEGRASGAVLETLGLTSRYTSEQRKAFQDLYGVMGQRNDFKRMVYRELMFQRPHGEQSPGRLGRALEGYAKFGSYLQDPTWGVRSATLARRYMDGAMQYLLTRPSTDVISIENIIAQMRTNPGFLEAKYPDAHQAALNNIAQIRSLKETVASQAIKGLVEPMANSTNSATNFLSNVLIKIPTIFAGYGMNVATSILGLQGLNDIAAAALHGRQKGPNSIIGRAQAAIRGTKQASDEFFDFDSVMDGIDLSRSFIRGGLTHTGLFALGMMAGSIGLTGEDDEAKRRRLMAKHQGVGHIYDPRSLENDFRNADAIFGDWLPSGIGVPHWMLKQFISPIIGMERFFQTGDARQIKWGFQDAISSFPLINSSMWADVNETADNLLNLADEEARKGEEGDTSGYVKASIFLTQMVGTYERMLFENSFVNQLYTGLDRWDRDPYVLPLTDSDGTIQRDIEGNARPNNLALADYFDGNELKQGYLSRDDAAAELRTMTESRATLAFVSSLFTGGIGDSDMWRYNMPIKTRTLDRKPVSQADAEAIMLAALQGANKGAGVPSLTIQEAEVAARNTYHEMTGEWAYDEVIMPLARAMVANTGKALLSETNAAGEEFVTDAGAEAIFRGLIQGTVKLGDESLRGVMIPYEMRERIVTKWSKEIYQEGLDMGLDETKAQSRMKRVLYGPFEQPKVEGLSELLFSDKISYDKTVTYGQLNTTYVLGPDGLPWATGFERGKLLDALGIKPVKNPILPEGNATRLDERLNVVDLVNGNGINGLGGESGINTGLRAIVPLDDSRYVPTDVEIGKSIEKAIEEAAASGQTPFTPFQSDKGGGGWGGYGGWRSYGGYGGGGGGGGGGSAYFVRMNPLARGMVPYGHNAPYVNTSNPIIRRADIRRERVWSERGRLKQWQ